MAKKTIKCHRCRKRLRASNANDGWHTRYDRGLPVAHVCPSCVTNAEHLEAEVNDTLPKLTWRGRVHEVYTAYPVPTGEGQDR